MEVQTFCQIEAIKAPSATKENINLSQNMRQNKVPLELFRILCCECFRTRKRDSEINYKFSSSFIYPQHQNMRQKNACKKFYLTLTLILNITNVE